MSAKVSVIIPVYKAEQYLRRCVDSLLAQTFSDFELMLVDDGSPDGSGAICDAYAASDARVKVIHKQNEGVSRARQCGLDNARGEYIIHADPDDWVDADMLRQMVECIEDAQTGSDADVVVCGHIREEGASRRVVEEPLATPLATSEDGCYADYSATAVFEELIANRLHGNVWSKLIRRSAIERHQLGFDPDLSLCEDYCFCCQLLSHDDVRVRFLGKAFYHYDLHSNENSIARIIRRPAIMSRARVACILDELIKYRPNFDALAEGVAQFKLNTKLLAFYYNALSDREFSELHSEINRLYVLSNNLTRPSDWTWKCVCLAMMGHARLGNLAWRVREKVKKVLGI